MKVAIGFFGITRSLKYTIDSINQNELFEQKAQTKNSDCYKIRTFS